MITNQLKVYLIVLLLISLTNQQNSICYSNCKEGYCSSTRPDICTACQLGQAMINGKCIPGSSLPYPITYLTYSSDTNRLNNSAQTSFNCQWGSGQSLGTLMYQTVPGTTWTRDISISERHQYIQIKFNAAVQSSNTAFLEYQITSSTDGTILYDNRISNANKTQSAVCGNVNVPSVFYIKQTISTNLNQITLQIKNLDSNSIFGVSNIEIYYGTCDQTCQTCSGPMPNQCLTCQGFYMQIVNGTCQTCPLGFYNNGNECLACPAHCQSCQFNNITKSVYCLLCHSMASLSSGQCNTNYTSYSMNNNINFTNFDGWTSTQTSGSPVTVCGKYALIGGIGIGRGDSNLTKTFSNLTVHSIIDISFTLFLIDQQQDQQNSYEVYIDGQTVAQNQFTIVAQANGYNLTNECGASNPEMISAVSLTGIPHSKFSTVISISSAKNFFGIRDFVLTVHNQSNVVKCAEQQNGTCLACFDGLYYENGSCTRCPNGYYLSSGQCNICPIECNSCEYDYRKNLKCTVCSSPLQLINGMCKDTTKSIFSREIIPNSLLKQQNQWVLYPRIPYNGISSCGNDPIIGSSFIQYKFLTMQRNYTNLPTHRGIKIIFNFYQIDQYVNQSVYFLFNGRRVNYNVSDNRKFICGQQDIADAIVKIELEDANHTDGSFTFQTVVNGKIKAGINNFVLFLENCEGCKNQFGFELQSIPQYSLSTPPVKGLQVKLIFDEPFQNSTDFDSLFDFSIQNPSQGFNQTTQRLLQNLILNDDLKILSEQLVSNRQYRALLNLDEDQNNQNIFANPEDSWRLISDSQTPAKLLSSTSVSSKMPRYIDVDQNDISHRKNMRNLRNLFQGCAIVALWIGLASFFFGLSAAFDDFFILVQVIFVHIFIQLANNPPSFRVPMQGFQIVQFMAWLPNEARQGIEDGIIPDSVYQKSPIQYQQYWQDIIFARAIYHLILFLVAMVLLYLLLTIFNHIINNSQRSKKKYSTQYFIKYYNDYRNHRFTFIDKVIRFSFFTVIWACGLQFIHFSNDPTSFNIWNGVLCIFMFVVFALYPILGFIYLKRASSTLSQTTFDKSYEEVRVRSGRLIHFLIRYYKLLAIALLIGLLYSVNPLACLIPLIFIHLFDGIFTLIFKPYNLETLDVQLNVRFYNKYPKVYWISKVIENFLFVLLELFILIMYAVRDKSSTNSYMGLGYTCCAWVILLLINGLVRLIWGLVKIIQGCYSKSKQMGLQVQKRVTQKQLQNNEQLVPIKSKSIKQLQNLQDQRMNTLRRQSYVSKIM